MGGVSELLNFRTNLAVSTNSKYLSCYIVFAVNAFDNATNATFRIVARSISATNTLSSGNTNVKIVHINTV